MHLHTQRTCRTSIVPEQDALSSAVLVQRHLKKENTFALQDCCIRDGYDGATLLMDVNRALRCWQVRPFCLVRSSRAVNTVVPSRVGEVHRNRRQILKRRIVFTEGLRIKSANGKYFWDTGRIERTNFSPLKTLERPSVNFQA